MKAMTTQNVTFNGEAETETFAETLSLMARSGQVILLKGDLGSGKSTFARAFIKALALPDDIFDVPSPSFSLVQLYENTRIPVAHIDLYRLNSPNEIRALALSELLPTFLLLVEWPERLDEAFSAPTIELEFSGSGNKRELQLRADDIWAGLLQRNQQIETFLENSAWFDAKRSFLEGDASSRRYEYLTRGGQKKILMDMPQRPDGPPVKAGRPYSAIAHLAENITSVVAINSKLYEMGYSAPSIEKFDLDIGLAIIENLGEQVFGRMMNAGQDITEPMQAAIELLADMATRNWSHKLAVDAKHFHAIEPYDLDAQLIEADLMVSWFFPFARSRAADSALCASFERAWRNLLPLAQPEKPHWALRDFHSPNLIWMPERQGFKRVGIIDTQDTVLGHPAYDLVSMLQDARVDIDFGWADELYLYYEQLRAAQGEFNRQKFSAAYAVLGAQRATKILGIFARLAKRDGKPGYIKHMPRVSRYLARNLEHKALSSLKEWYETNLPEALKVGRP